MMRLRTTASQVLDRIRHPGPWTDDDFGNLALSLYEAQRAAIPPYDAWCRYELSTRGADAVRRWQDVPALPVAAFRELPVGEPGQAAVATWTSSGTTSAARSIHRLPTTELYDASLDHGVASALVPDVASGERPPLGCVQLQPDLARAPSSSLSHMYDRIRLGGHCTDRDAFVDGDYRLDAAGAWQALRRCAAEREPALLLATSFALAMLLEAAEEGGWGRLQLPPGSRVVDTGGFKGRTRELTRELLLSRVERQLGIPAQWCENEYGMSELSSQAWLGTVAAAAGHPVHCAASGVRWAPPWLRVRVVDPATLEEVPDGGTGLLVFHDLANAWSCAAVRSEDLGIRRGCSFELVGRAPGTALKGCSLRLEDVVDEAPLA